MEILSVGFLMTLVIGAVLVMYALVEILPWYISVPILLLVLHRLLKFLRR